MLKTTYFFLVLVTVFSGVAGKLSDAKAAKVEKDEVFEEHKNWMITPEEEQERSRKRGYHLLGATSSSILGGNLGAYGPYFGWTGHSLGLGNPGYFSSAFEQSPWVQYQMTPQILHSIGFQPAFGSALGHLQVGVGLAPEAMSMMGEVVGTGIINQPEILQFVQPVRARYVRVRLMVPGYLQLAGVLLNPLPCEDTCQIQFEVGKCAPGQLPHPAKHWFHNMQLDTCEAFIYSGCGGNNNNFATPKQCMDACVQRKPCRPGYKHPTPTSKKCVPIPINGGFSRWTEYGSCSKSCGVGFQVRTRTCTNPVPRFGGRNCIGYRVMKRFCKIKMCPVPNPCKINKGGCSDHCKFSGKRGDPAVCYCNEGYELASDQKTCVEIATCKNAADVGFILDASGSLLKHFPLEKKFLSAVAGAFRISKTGSRASVITFSDRSVLSIKFSDTSNIMEFTKKVNRIRNFDSNTRIDTALKLAKNEMFTEANGMRPNLPNILFLITDGSQTKEDDWVEPAPIAAQLRASGVELICVGIGEQIKKDELIKIAGNPKHVYTAANFQKLVSQSFIDEVKAKACPGNKAKATTSSGSSDAAKLNDEKEEKSSEDKAYDHLFWE